MSFTQYVRIMELRQELLMDMDKIQNNLIQRTRRHLTFVLDKMLLLLLPSYDFPFIFTFYSSRNYSKSFIPAAHKRKAQLLCPRLDLWILNTITGWLVYIQNNPRRYRTDGGLFNQYWIFPLSKKTKKEKKWILGSRCRKE